MFRTKSAVAAVAVACLAFPASLLATPAFAVAPSSVAKVSKVVVFSDRDDDENEHESDHHEGHHQIPPVVIRPHHEDSEDDGDDDGEDGAWGSSGEDEGDDESDDENGGFVVPGPAPLPGVIDPSPLPVPAPDQVYALNDPTGASVNSSNYSVSPISGIANDALAVGQPPVSAGRSLNPEAAPPVAIEQVRGPQRTPADVFMESATVGLLAVGAGAVALGGVAGVRAIKLRRNPKGDYFYGDQN